MDLQRPAATSSRRLLTRRRFIQSAIVLAAGIGAYTRFVEPTWLEVVGHDLPVIGLPSSLAGLTLAQLSDLHTGSRVSSEYLVRSLQRLTSLKPDILVITGDIMDDGEQVAQAAKVMRHCPVPPLGAFVIMGNHDYGHGWRSQRSADELSAAMRALGMTVLRNDVAEVRGLHIVGLDDLWGANFDPQPVLSQLPSGAPAIVLCHNPDAADLPVWADFHGWILAGHTHGGQCKPPFLPPPVIPVRNHRYTSGEFELSSGRRLYISRGVGHLTRVRINCRPEITLHRLISV